MLDLLRTTQGKSKKRWKKKRVIEPIKKEKGPLERVGGLQRKRLPS